MHAHQTAKTAIPLLFALVCLVLYTDTIQVQLQSAISRCLTVLIPSLYAMMILAQLLTSTGIWHGITRPFQHLSQTLFHLPSGCFALFLLSQIAGYPVGASILRNLNENGTLSKQDASRLLCLCSGGGPALLLGLFGQQPHRLRLFGIMLISQILANFFLLFLLLRRNPIQMQNNRHLKVQPLSAAMLVESTAKAGRSLLLMCGVVLLFSAFCGICEALGIFHGLSLIAAELDLAFPIEMLLESILEVTYATNLSLPFFVQVPVLTGLLSFGGICVILSAGSGWLGMLPFDWTTHPEAQTVMRTLTPAVSQSGIFPACMLLIMTILLLFEIRT